jgi:hypothetical protein
MNMSADTQKGKNAFVIAEVVVQSQRLDGRIAM